MRCTGFFRSLFYCKTNIRMRGATLVDVVVACIAVAVGVSLVGPASESKKELSMEEVCKRNLMRLGEAQVSFTEDHEGRFPGYMCLEGNPKWAKLPWQHMLNHEIFGHELTMMIDGLGGGQTIRWVDSEVSLSNDEIEQLHGDDVDFVRDKDRIWCPAKALYPRTSTRAYRMNMYAAGMPMFQKMGGGTGKRIEHPNPKITDYYLGMKPSAFHDPALTILHQEAVAANDHFQYRQIDSVELINKERAEELNCPTWCGNVNGNTCEWSFRHKMKTNILLIDCHVELVGAEGELNTKRRILPANRLD